MGLGQVQSYRGIGRGDGTNACLNVEAIGASYMGGSKNDTWRFLLDVTLPYCP